MSNLFFGLNFGQNPIVLSGNLWRYIQELLLEVHGGPYGVLETE